MLPLAAGLLLWAVSAGAASAQMVAGTAQPPPPGPGTLTQLPGTPPSPVSASNALPSSNAGANSNVIISPANFLRTNLTLVDPLALCNDGSPGYFYFRPGTGNGTNKWVIRFEGGGFCSDQASCVARAQATPNLMGSAGMWYPDVMSGMGITGVLDADVRANPLMFSWNHVSIGYCSSDSYLGNAGPSDSPENGVFQFRGQRIVNATILNLLATKKLAAATDIMIVGVSAGGVGVMNLADGIYSTIQPKAPALTNFKAYVDGGWFLDIPSYSNAPSAFTFRKTAQNFVTNFAATFNPSCAAVYPGQTWACFFASYAWPYIRTPLIFHEYLYDGANVGYLATGSQANLNDVRSRLTTGDLAPASAVTGPAPSSASPAPSATVATQSLAQPPPGLAAPPGLYAPGFANVPPGVPPSGLTGLLPSPPSPPAAAAANQSTPPLPSQKSPAGSGALPAVFAPACGNHNIADNDLFSVSHIGTTRFTDTLTAWFTTGKAGLPLVDPTPGLASPMYCMQAI